MTRSDFAFIGALWAMALYAVGLAATAQEPRQCPYSRGVLCARTSEASEPITASGKEPSL